MLQEPHSNGPLFVETNFYLRATRLESIQRWKKQHHLLHLGVPHVGGNSGLFRCVILWGLTLRDLNWNNSKLLYKYPFLPFKVLLTLTAKYFPCGCHIISNSLTLNKFFTRICCLEIKIFGTIFALLDLRLQQVLLKSVPLVG